MSGLRGPLFATLAITLFSVNDVIMKSLTDDFALHQAILFRSTTGLLVTVLLMAPFLGGFGQLCTQRLGMHSLRACMVIFANVFFFLGLAALPLATNVALFFINPFVVTVLSVFVLGETVGPRRWGALAVGIAGVLLILRPGTDSFQAAALFPLLAAFGYAGLNIMTRYLRDTENGVNMVFYIQLIFLLFCIVVGILVGDGRYGDQENPSLAFLLRAWVWPEWLDLPALIGIGFLASIGGYFISQAYRLASVVVIAPFEFLALPLSVLWGIFLFCEWPDIFAWSGISLILAAGLYTVYREQHSAGDTEKPN
ncbi:MAG: DMT family transporter [Pseudomonadota bacterium]